MFLNLLLLSAIYHIPIEWSCLLLSPLAILANTTTKKNTKTFLGMVKAETQTSQKHGYYHLNHLWWCLRWPKQDSDNLSIVIIPRTASPPNNIFGHTHVFLWLHIPLHQTFYRPSHIFIWLYLPSNQDDIQMVVGLIGYISHHSMNLSPTIMV